MFPKQNPAYWIKTFWNWHLWKHILSLFDIFEHIKWYGPLHHGAHFVSCIETWFPDVHRSHDAFWQARISVRPFLASGRFWHGNLIMKTQVKTSREHVSVRQKWLNHGTRMEWEYKSSISWTSLCSGDFRGRYSFHFGAWVRICFQLLAASVSPTVEKCIH